MKNRNGVGLLLLIACMMFSGFCKAQISMKKQEVFKPVTAIKYNISAMASADYGISIERKVTKKASCELGAGATLKNSVLEDFNLFNPKPEDYVNYGRINKVGFSGRVTGKYFFNSYPNAIDGFYIGGEFMYRRYNSVIQNEYQGPQLWKEYNDQKEIRALLGWTMDLGESMSLPIIWEYVIGVGYRIQERKYMSYEDRDNPIDDKIKLWTKKFPTAYVGIKMGFSISDLF